MAKWTCTAVMEFPVITEVEAETYEQAQQIARKRLPGPDLDKDWTLDERFYNPTGSRAEN